MPVFKEYDQGQGVFRSIRPNELLEPDHPARVIDKVAEMLDLGEVYGDYFEEGNPAYHPQMMMKVLFYAYYCGLMSSRRIWDGLKERADFIFLSGDQVPDFRTINAFRTRHMKVLPKLFTQILMICVRLDMVDFQHLAVDGQKIKANANYRRSKNRQRTRQSYTRVKEAITRVISKPVNEDFTEEKKAERLEKLRKQKESLLELKKTLEAMEDEEATVNMTDPDAKVMKHKDGRSLPSYNHQSAVDGKLGVVCAVATQDESDKPKDLFSLVDQAKENAGCGHENVVADPAFCDYETLQQAESTRKEEYFLPDKLYEVAEHGTASRGKYASDNFEHRDEGTAVCPEGKPMQLKAVTNHEDGHTVSIYEGKECENCSKREKCTSGKKRTIAVDSREPFRERMREKLRSDHGRETYMKRQGIVEPTHGNDQKNKGWVQHYLRGKGKAALEFMLVRIATNLGKIVRYRAMRLMAVPT
jgi:transposase